MLRFLIPIVLGLVATPILADLYHESGPAVILLNVHGTYKGGGTGFLVSPNGLVLTAGHNIPNSELFDEDGVFVEGYFPAPDVDALSAADPPVKLKLIHKSLPPYDVALLQILNDEKVRPFLRLCDAYKKQDGLRFYVLGYPGGDRLLTSIDGPISAGAGAVSNLVVQLPVNPGNSGGPLFNELGMVFGIAIGERTVSGERMNQSALAVPMAKAISTLGNDANSLIGTSYDPDCTKPLSRHVVKSLSVPVEFDRMTPDENNEMKGDGMFGPYTGMGVAQAKAPAGYKITDVSEVKWDKDNIKGLAIISDNGSYITIKGVDRSHEKHISASTIKVTFEQVPSSYKTPASQFRSFPFTKTLSAHGLNVTTQTYNEKILAPEGFFFNEVIKTYYESLKNSPSKGMSTIVSKDGSALELKFTLQSGPENDPWSGWIDALITAKLSPKR